MGPIDDELTGLEIELLKAHRAAARAKKQLDDAVKASEDATRRLNGAASDYAQAIIRKAHRERA